MLFLGVDFGGGPQQTYAIKINESEVGYEELNRRTQEREMQIERALGENYRQFAGQLLKGLQQQVVDEIINENLLHQAVTEEGMAPGKQFVQNLLVQLFQGNFSMEKYQLLLRQIQTTAPAFENRLATETLSLQLRGLMRHVSLFPPEQLAEQIFRQKETLYTVSSFSLSPEAVRAKVEIPEDEVLEQFFYENQIDYEIPARIRATYVRFPAESYRRGVAILEEDVEAYYLDHEREFRIPAAARIREIVLPLKEGDISEQLKTEGIADELVERLANGDDFLKIAKEYSQDSLKGEASEWIARGTQGIEFDSAIFSDESPLNTITRVATPKQIRLVEILERKDDSVKPLDEVREQIEESIRLTDAPIYAAEKARTLFETWQEGNTSLEELVKNEQLKIEKLEKLTSLQDATTPSIRAIVKEALEQLGEERLLVDVGTELALVFIDEYRELELPAFDDVREKVIEQYRTAEAPALARQIAIETTGALVGENGEALSENILKERGFSVKKYSDKKAQELRELPFTEPAVQEALVSQTEAGILASSPLDINGTQYIIQVNKTTPPNQSIFSEQQDALKQQSSQKIARLLEVGLLAHLKSKGEIDIAPAVFNQ